MPQIQGSLLGFYSLQLHVSSWKIVSVLKLEWLDHPQRFLGGGYSIYNGGLYLHGKIQQNVYALSTHTILVCCFWVNWTVRSSQKVSCNNLLLNKNEYLTPWWKYLYQMLKGCSFTWPVYHIWEGFLSKWTSWENIVFWIFCLTKLATVTITLL